MSINHKQKLRAALMGSAAWAFMAAPVILAPSSAMAQDQAADDGAPVDQIVITGSRIPRTGFDTVAPATVVDAEFVDIRGFDNVAGALNELPGFFSGVSNNGGQSSQNVGQNFVNAFGLGTQRTLTLINGRRTVGQNTPTLVNTAAGGGLQVDLNIIPTALLDRIETVFTGGAPIYGSDAIAGTVNIILKDDYEGLSLEGQWGTTEQGGAEQYRMRAAVGSNFADGRGNVAFAIEYSKQNGLQGIERPQWGNGFRSNCTNLLDTGPNDGIPDEVLCEDAVNVWQLPTSGFIIPNTSPIPFANDPSLPFGIVDGDGDAIMFDLDGSLMKARDANLGDSSRGNPGIFFSEGADGFNNPYVLSINAETTSFRSPLERFLTFGTAHYDLTDNIRFTSEVMWSRSESADVVSQPPWGTVFFAPGQNASKINITDNPFVSQELKDLLETNGAFTPIDPLDPTTQDDPETALVDESDQFFIITRANIDFVGGGRAFRDQNVMRFSNGLEGDFELGGRTWNWEMAYTFGQTHSNAEQLTLNFQHLGLGTDAIAADQAIVDSGNVAAGNWFIRNGKSQQVSATNALKVGDIVCRSTAERPGALFFNDQFAGGISNSSVDTCVPIDIQGFNQFTEEARDFATQVQIQTTMLQQSVFEASVSSELFDLPAGPVGFATGYTHRRERGRFAGGQGSEIGINPNAPVVPSGGGFNTHEVYGEIFVPLIAGGEGMGSFLGSIIADWTFEGAVRIVDNNLAGSGTTWTAGGRLTPNLPFLGNALTIRGNYTEAIRSPSIPELFQPLATAFFFANDPCDERFIDDGPVPATRRANCEAEVASFQAAGLLPAGFDLDGGAPGTGIEDPDGRGHRSIIVNASQPGLTGGNLDLANETSKAWSVGFVFEPDAFFPGFTLSADWTEITISDAMVTPSATQVANACFDSPIFKATELAGGFKPCDAFSRHTVSTAPGPNQAFDFIAPLTVVLNAAVREFAGLTLNAQYDFVLEDLFIPFLNTLPGSGSFSMNYFYLSNDRQTIGLADLDVFTGEFNNEQHTIQANLTYQMERFSGLLQMRRIGAYIPSNENSPENRDINRIPAWMVFNLTLQYQITDNIKARMVVNNVFDNTGSSPIQQAYSIRDPFGRRYLFSIGADF